jgi:hypothetical protein
MKEPKEMRRPVDRREVKVRFFECTGLQPAQDPKQSWIQGFLLKARLKPVSLWYGDMSGHT